MCLEMRSGANNAFVFVLVCRHVLMLKTDTDRTTDGKTDNTDMSRRYTFIRISVCL